MYLAAFYCLHILGQNQYFKNGDYNPYFWTTQCLSEGESLGQQPQISHSLSPGPGTTLLRPFISSTVSSILAYLKETCKHLFSCFPSSVQKPSISPYCLENIRIFSPTFKALDHLVVFPSLYSFLL